MQLATVHDQFESSHKQFSPLLLIYAEGGLKKSLAEGLLTANATFYINYLHPARADYIRDAIAQFQPSDRLLHMLSGHTDASDRPA